MPRSNDQSAAVVLILVIGVTAVIGVFVWGMLSSSAVDFGVDTGDTTIEYLNDGDAYDLGLRAQNVDVSVTNGYALSFPGDGHVDAVTGTGWYSGDWSVLLPPTLAADANQNGTYSLIGYDNETVVVEFTDGNWSAYHFKDDGSAHATIPASTPTQHTALGVFWDNSTGTLTITDGSATDSGSLTSDTPVRHVASDWYGTLDEVRFIDGDASGVFGTYQSDPINPLSTQDHTARYMFEEGSGSQTYAYFEDTEVGIVNASWVSGIEGPTVDGGTDYRVDGETFTVLDGYLDGHPVAYVSWESQLSPGLTLLIDNLGAVTALFGVALVVIAARVVSAGAGSMGGSLR